MRRYQRNHAQAMFHGSEMLRLVSSIGMLVIVAMLILHFRQPGNVGGLVGKQRAKDQGGRDEIPSPGKGEGGRDEIPSHEKSQVAAKPQAPSGPTDQDPEEAEAAKEQFEVVTDGTTAIQPEETPAYNRLVRWTVNQPVEVMRKRASANPVLNQFMQTPDEYRGKLFSLDLNMHRVLKYDKPNAEGVQLYEVWGWTTESRGWLYVGVVVDLPAGMPIGPDVSERATLVGYFFKLQGYHSARSQQGDRPQRAPLLIGRLIWHPTQAPNPRSQDWLWGIVIVIVIVAVFVVRVAFGFLRGQRPAAPAPVRTSANPAAVPIGEWLEQAETGEAAGQFDQLDEEQGGEDNRNGQ